LGASIDHPNGHAVKTLESKETEAQRNETVTHNSVFAAHRLKMPDDDYEIDIRHFPFWRIAFKAVSDDTLLACRYTSTGKMPVCRVRHDA
jgi:hypothetical protein